MFVTPTYFSKFLSSFPLNFISYRIRVNSSSVLVAQVQLKVLQVVVGNEVVHVAPGARFFLTGIVFVTTVRCVICMGLVYGRWCPIRIRDVFAISERIRVRWVWRPGLSISDSVSHH